MARPPKEADLSTFHGRVGAEIRKRRMRAKLSVEDAAGAADVPAPTWYHWESGRHLALERLPTIAAALNCKVRDLIPAGE